MDSYLNLIANIGDETRALADQAGSLPCPTNCFDCCRNTATMSISLVEAKHLGIGLKTLPHSIQEHVQKKAERTINKIEKEGYSEAEVVTAGTEAAETIKGHVESECPMLLGGVCIIYDYRPIICRVWGYPIQNNLEISCCKKTFLDSEATYKPLPYDQHWNDCKKLSGPLKSKQKEDAAHRIPICYFVQNLLKSG